MLYTPPPSPSPLPYVHDAIAGQGAVHNLQLGLLVADAAAIQGGAVAGHGAAADRQGAAIVVEDAAALAGVQMLPNRSPG